jgi:hypothetical protein
MPKRPYPYFGLIAYQRGTLAKLGFSPLAGAIRHRQGADIFFANLGPIGVRIGWVGGLDKAKIF